MEKILICSLCNEQTERRSQTQKYCPKCSEIKSRERNRQWAQEHPLSKEKIDKKTAILRSRVIQKGMEISQANSRISLLDNCDFKFNTGWVVKFKFPYTQAASKNHLWSLAKGGGHLFKRQEVRQYQNGLAYIVKSAISDVEVYNNKIWIDLFVQKPNHKSDAINVVDIVCDAIKVGVGIDDRWFCIKQLDWEITKVDPHIFISIYQPDLFDAQACSHCGRILPTSTFTRASHNKSGFGRVCKQCRTKTGTNRER